MRLFVIVFATSWLIGCIDGEPTTSKSATPSQEDPSEKSSTEGGGNPNNAVHVSREELEVRRQEVINQVNKLRDRELNYPFGFVAVPNPVPSSLPGTVAHEWSQDDTIAEGIGRLEFSPGDKGGGSTYAQFQVEVAEDASDFTITARTDLDGDGAIGIIEATKTLEAQVIDPNIW